VICAEVMGLEGGKRGRLGGSEPPGGAKWGRSWSLGVRVKLWREKSVNCRGGGGRGEKAGGGVEGGGGGGE